MSGPKKETPQETPQSEPAAAPAASSTAQATAVVGSAVNIVRERLVAGEQLLLAAAGAIVVVYLLFEFLLDYGIFVGGFVPVLSVLTILAIWVHRWGHYDFGRGYRVVAGALGISLALFAITSLLAWLRVGGNSVDFLHLIGRLVYWVAGIAAGYGGWLVFRTRAE
jgi:hypothetical protein